jgi:5-formyltetrahydrofolate cyclo-ligase
MTDKAALRKALRRQRASLPVGARQRAERAVVRHLCRLLTPRRRVAAYWAVGAELSLAGLFAAASKKHRVEVYLPLIPKRGRIMQFSKPGMTGPAWRKNRFGIAEYHGATRLAARQLDMVLLPLVGFDAAGHRLGQGGGFYDATFAFRRRRKHWKKPRLIGVGFECQRVDHIPTDPHDVLLDIVVTETGWHHCGR